MTRSVTHRATRRTEEVRKQESLRRPGSQTLDPFVLGRPLLRVTLDLIEGGVFYIINPTGSKIGEIDLFCI
jgi:hypothetical protein